jgi:hypothetical protein
MDSLPWRWFQLGHTASRASAFKVAWGSDSRFTVAWTGTVPPDHPTKCDPTRTIGRTWYSNVHPSESSQAPRRCSLPVTPRPEPSYPTCNKAVGVPPTFPLRGNRTRMLVGRGTPTTTGGSGSNRTEEVQAEVPDQRSTRGVEERESGRARKRTWQGGSGAGPAQAFLPRVALLRPNRPSRCAPGGGQPRDGERRVASAPSQ